MKMSVDKLLEIVKNSKGKVKRDAYVACYADVKSEGSDMNAICVGATFGKYGIRFLISDADNVMDYIDNFKEYDDINSSNVFNSVFIDDEPYTMTNYDFVDALFKYEAYCLKKKINLANLTVDVTAELAGGFECTFKNFKVDSNFFRIDVICEDFD